MAIMPHPSQSTLYLAVPETTAIQAGANNLASASVAKGASLIATGVTITGDCFVYGYQSNETDTTGKFFSPMEFTLSSSTSGRLEFKVPRATAITAAYGGCLAPAFTVPPGARTTIISNDSGAKIYFRVGTANASGIVIAKPGDTNGDDVQGIPLLSSQSYVTWPGEWVPGTRVHLLATTAGQYVTVAFHA